MKRGMILLIACLLTTNIQAQQKKDFLSAKESDPVKMGWMQGFPPPKDKVLNVADGSFFKFPALRWSVVHMRQFLPTVNVSRGLGVPSQFTYQLDRHIDNIDFFKFKKIIKNVEN